MFGLGPMELVIIFMIALLVFGAKKIPEIAQGLGKGITEFKKAAREVTDEIENASKASPSTPRVKNELKNQSSSDTDTTTRQS
jgi:sec-independent protein translocase protein TatA